MTERLKLPHEGMVLVSDGRKALLLRNAGNEVDWNLTVDRVLEAPDNPSTAEQGTDRPGRAFAAGGQRSAMGETDWHDLAEIRFAGDVAKAFEEAAARAKAVIVAAPPRTLAELRKRFSAPFKTRIVAEVDKDLTRHPVYEIEKRLRAGR
ncbi:host attachment protein [Microvirga thermotolerans]|uniref:Host attachment protein n=1 Tax=Microvirga thermotolerans TaxID=2651334 RepID=A0A5P9JQE5_9HYPH|nr:host attachment family protein [Microvirga thermotolerans]QFU14982.1 host attachment protein [Microvirga thermotolerans]